MPPRTRNLPRRHRVVIVGGGMAGARLAHQLDQLQGPAGTMPRCQVTVLAQEPHPAYNRVLLAEVLAGRYGAELIGLPDPAPTVRWRGGVRAVRVDRVARRVIGADGGAVPYDSLVLATGASPVLPPLRGLAGPSPASATHPLPYGVAAFRTLDDCRALVDAASTGARAVVVGGGPLGVSAAHALARRGARVALVHHGPHLMQRHLDGGAAHALRHHLTALGVAVHTERPARAVLTAPRDGAESGPDRAARAVELADGHRLPAEVVVLACGVRPRVGLARAAGLEVARGIVVDDDLTTSDPHIHALGDCVEHDGVLYGRAEAAQEQADLLARALATRLAEGGRRAGAVPRYTGTRALTRLTLTGPAPRDGRPPIAGHDGTGPGRRRGSSAPPAEGARAAPRPRERGALDLASCGVTAPRPDDHVIRLSDAARGVYRVLVLRGGRLAGGVLLGDLGTVGALARAWESDEPLPAASPLHLLTAYGGS